MFWRYSTLKAFKLRFNQTAESTGLSHWDSTATELIRRIFLEFLGPKLTVQDYNNTMTMAAGYPAYQQPMTVLQQPAPAFQQPAPLLQQPAPPFQQPAPAFQQPQLGFQQPQLVFQPPQQQIQFMPRPEGIPGVPPGLEYLTQVCQLMVQQQEGNLEMATGWEIVNKYKVVNAHGQQVYFATEESGTCERQCFGTKRGFIMHITDNLGQEVFRAVREFKCCAGWNCFACLDCCASEIRIEAPVGQIIGYARQLYSCTQPRYSISDSAQQEVLYIEGPMFFCKCSCCPCDRDFRVKAQGRNQEIGKISKKFQGFAKESQADADNFSVSFPMDLDVRKKAILLGSVFLIDFMYFEEK